ncbi:MAG TPA: cytochrome c-type biogenesis protein CcmH [Candidatus Aquilonibacter sp.]|nr:cytochrome c-type biogenesis protein CcmH [Candidatus Aquilonibacter sp.]
MKAGLAAVFFVSSAVVLSPQQAAEVKNVEESLVAPCCYRQSVAEHPSDVAEQMREEITAMVASGESRGEIIQHYKELYGERILIVPEGKTHTFLFTLPFVMTALGLGFLFLWLRARAPTDAGALLAANPQLAEALRERFRDEVARQTGD